MGATELVSAMVAVYILQSLRNGKYYIGSTVDLKNRLKQHNAGVHPSGKRLGPFKLAFRQEYDNLVIARKIERRLKRFKRKDFIAKIIEDGHIKLKT